MTSSYIKYRASGKESEHALGVGLPVSAKRLVTRHGLEFSLLLSAFEGLALSHDTAAPLFSSKSLCNVFAHPLLPWPEASVRTGLRVFCSFPEAPSLSVWRDVALSWEFSFQSTLYSQRGFHVF